MKQEAEGVELINGCLTVRQDEVLLAGLLLAQNRQLHTTVMAAAAGGGGQ